MVQYMTEGKKVLIRADGNARIGAGHLMRCLTIADAFSEKEKIGFVCAEEESAAFVCSRGYEACVLYTDYKEMRQELPYWETLSGRDRVILIDSYYATKEYLQKVRKAGRTVLLDDMAKEAKDADAVINYNAFATVGMYEALNGSSDTKYYTGSAYLPIRREFCDRHYRVREDAKHILITTGGGDQENIAGQILDRIRNHHYEYHVVTGRFNPHYDKLLKSVAASPNIHIYHDVRDMAELMLSCDAAVTAGGTTVYELSALGVPFICFSYAENQEKLTEYIGKEKVAGYGGAFHKKPEETLAAIAEQTAALMKNYDRRLQYSLTEQKLADGQGAGRIAELINGLL